MTGFIYILLTKNDHYYVDSTIDLERRLKEHSLGKTNYLRRLLPVKLVFSQKYDDIITARKIEIKPKGFKNRKIIEQIVKEGKIKISHSLCGRAPR